MCVDWCVCVYTCVPVHMRVRDLHILCVCEGEWGIVSNGERVYCSQMWTGMWRVGMQWLLLPPHPSFSPLLLPFVPVSRLALPETPHFAPETRRSRSISLSTTSRCFCISLKYVLVFLLCSFLFAFFFHSPTDASCDIVYLRQQANILIIKNLLIIFYIWSLDLLNYSKLRNSSLFEHQTFCRLIDWLIVFQSVDWFTE